VANEKIEIPVPEAKEVQNVIERPNEAIPHIVDHEGRITHMEEQQAARYTELLQKIDDTRAEIFTAMEHAHTEQASVLEERLKRLEEAALRIESTIVEAPPKVVEELEQAPTEAVQVVPEVEHVAQKIIPRGIRGRRKAKHHG
jgi:DNA-binding HxlR family transcriptional regulator